MIPRSFWPFRAPARTDGSLQPSLNGNTCSHWRLSRWEIALPGFFVAQLRNYCNDPQIAAKMRPSEMPYFTLQFLDHGMTRRTQVS